jgi:hypothetical protein
MTDLLSYLMYRLETLRGDFDKFDAYVLGEQPLAFIAPETLTATQGRLKNLNIGWPRLVIDSIEERLDVVGFRSRGGQPEDKLWQMWQDNGMDQESQMLHQDSLIYGIGYAMVWADDSGQPRITVESPRECYVQCYPGSRRRRWAVKRWYQDDQGHATMFTESTVRLYRTEATFTNPFNDPAILDSYTPGGWTQIDEFPNPLKVVPIVPFVNRPRVRKPYGESELHELLPIFDAVNKLRTDMMVSSEFYVDPKRWATGVTLPETLDADGNPTGEVDTSKAFSQARGRVWLAESPDAKLGQFPSSDLNGNVNAIANLTQTLGALSGLPPHYLGLHGDQPASADAIRSAESSLVAKVRRKQRILSGGWEEVMRLATAIRDGSFNPAYAELETLWSDPETRTVAQAADSAMKLVSGGLLSSDMARPPGRRRGAAPPSAHPRSGPSGRPRRPAANTPAPAPPGGVR